MLIKRDPLIAVLSIVGVALVGGFCVALSALFDRSSPDDQMVFPIEWAGITDKSATVWENSSILLQSDGTAELTDVLGGFLMEVDGVTCVNASPRLYSGPAEWDTSEDGAVILSFAAGRAVLYPSPARFQGIDWRGLREPMCDGTAIEYGARTQRR